MQFSEEHLPISERSLSYLLKNSLTSSPCFSIKKNTKVWIAIGMLIHYLESFTDSLVVREGPMPIGLVAGKTIIINLIKNPTADFLDNTKVEDIMEKDVLVVTPQTKLGDLLLKWVQTRRAFALIKNRHWDYSPLSVRRLLEIGAKCKTTCTISEMPKKKVITFKKDDTIGDIMNSMLVNKTRKLLLEGSSQFINDRVICEKIKKELDYLHGVDNFLDLPINPLQLPKAQVISEDVTIPEISKIMNSMVYPYVIFKDQVISSWDICLSLQSEEIIEYDSNTLPYKIL